MLFGSFGIAQAATSNDLKEEKILENPYIYEYGYGAVDTPNGTCYVYGKYVILAEDQGIILSSLHLQLKSQEWNQYALEMEII